MSTLTSTPEPVAEAPTPTPTEAPASTAESLANDWRSGLPEDIKSDPSLKAIQDVDSLAKSYVHSQRMLGADKVHIPNKYATDTEWRSFYHKAGLPEEVKDYELSSGNAEVDKDFFQDYKKASHEAGVLPSQAQKMFNWHMEKAAAESETQAKRQTEFIESNINTLKTDWGAAYDSKIKSAQAAINHFGDPVLRQHLETTGLGNDSKLIKVFSKIGETLSDDNFKGESSTGNYGNTPEQATHKINEIMANPKHAYFDRQHPEHKKALEDMQRLFTYKG